MQRTANHLRQLLGNLKWSAIAVIAGILLHFIFVHKTHASDRNETKTPIKFEYVFQHPAVENPRQIDSQAMWRSLNPDDTSLKPVTGKALWLRFKVPATDSFTDPVIMFERLQLSFRYFHENKLISSFGESVPYPGLPVHFLPVPSSKLETTGWLRVNSSLPRIGPRGSVYLGSRLALTVDLVKSDSTDLFVISILLLIGISGLVLYVLYPRVKTYLNLSLFAISSVLYFIGRLPSKVVFGIDPVVSGFVGLCGLYATPFFFLSFFREIFSVRYSKLLRRLQFASAAFIVFAVIFSFVTPSGPLNLLLIFYPLAIAVFGSAIFYAAAYLHNHNYVKTFFSGVLILFAAGLWEVAREIRLFHDNIPVITWGFLGFAGSLVIMQGRYFKNLFGQVLESRNATEEARLRLERVLNCTRKLSTIRSYKDLIQVFADSLIVELKLNHEDVTIDFFMPPDSTEKNEDNILQFSYLFSSTTGTGQLFSIKGQITNESPDKKIINANLSLKPTIDPEFDWNESLFKSESIPTTVLTIPIISLRTVGAVTIRKYTEGTFNTNDIQHVRKYVNSLSASLQIALQNLDYVDEVKVRATIENELLAAESLQAALLPAPLELQGIQYSAFCKSAGRTGGDWHGYYYCEEQNKLFLTIGDVTGHDFAASIMTGLAAGAVKAWEENDAKRFSNGKEALEDLALLVNRVFCGSNRGLKFMSMFFACIDLDTGKLHILNAGHPHPYQISRKNGLIPIVSSGHILGQSSESTFKAEVLELGEGDSILFYTDGLFENQGPLGDCLTKRNILSSLNREMNAHEVLESVLAKAQVIWGDNPAEDDVTLVAVTWNPKNQKSRAVA